MTRLYSSISVETTLSSTISNSATSMTVAAGTGSALLGGVTLAAGNVDQFTVAIDPDTANEEIVFITGSATDTFTIVRARAGTSGVQHSAGATVKHVLTSDDLTFYTTGVATANAAVPKSTLTTTGDTFYASAANTPARLAIGSTGQVLTVAGGLPSWATPAAGGGMTQLGSTTTLSGTTTTISSISGSYKHLLIIVDRITSSGSGSYNNFTITPNSLSTSTTVSYVESGSGGTVGNTLETTINGGYTANSFEAAGEQSYAIWIYNYASTTLYKPVLVTGLFKNTAIPTPRVTGVLAGGAITSTAAINALTITTTQPNTNGGKIILYGVS